MTVEELAAASGMTVRNIRAHQARGLLAAPEVRMRVGYYGPEHLAQLQLIRELQDDGFNLGGIKRLLEDTEGTAERLLRFKHALARPGEGVEQPEMLTLTELGRRFRLSREEARGVLAEAAKLGVLIPVGGDRYEVPSPTLLALAEQIAARGISLGAAMRMLEEIQRHCDSVSRAFVKLFLKEVWKPFERADMPAEQWPEMEAAVEALRPLASQAVLAVFQQRLAGQVEDAFGEIARRLAVRRR